MTIATSVSFNATLDSDLSDLTLVKALIGGRTRQHRQRRGLNRAQLHLTNFL